jgi:hypothetical protein
MRALLFHTAIIVVTVAWISPAAAAASRPPQDRAGTVA